MTHTPDPYQRIIQDLPEHLQHNVKLLAAIERKALHGHFVDWLNALNESLDHINALGCFDQLEPILDQPQVEVCAPIDVDTNLISRTLKALCPWRKGPFRIFNVDLASEWRCYQKYERLVTQGPCVQGQRILDVGSGNGYFGFRMLGAGARQVLNIDPSLLYWCQFQSIKMWLPKLPIAQIPLTAEALVGARLGKFDQVYSMGVLYHRKSPIEHL